MSSQYVAVAVAGALAAATLAPSSFPKYLKKFFGRYSDGQPAELDRRSKDYVEEVLRDVDLPPVKEVAVDTFPAFGLEPLYFGATSLRQGCLIGLPTNFRYELADDIRRDLDDVDAGILAKEAISWESPSGEALLQSLVLSSAAKKFLIARQIGYADSGHLWITLGLRVGMFSLAYSGAYILNRALQWQTRAPRLVRVLNYGLIGAVASAFYVVLHDGYTYRLDGHVDRYAAKLGRTYCIGGIEYYDKLLARNRALRQLLPRGPSDYTLSGNDVARWRLTQMQTSTRLENLRKTLSDSYPAIVTTSDAH